MWRRGIVWCKNPGVIGCVVVCHKGTWCGVVIGRCGYARGVAFRYSQGRRSPGVPA